MAERKLRSKSHLRKILSTWLFLQDLFGLDGEGWGRSDEVDVADAGEPCSCWPLLRLALVTVVSNSKSTYSEIPLPTYAVQTSVQVSLSISYLQVLFGKRQP